MKERQKTILLLLILAVTTIFVFETNVEASTKVNKNGYYHTILNKKKIPLRDPADGSVYGYLKYIKKVSLKKNKLTTTGNYYYAKNESSLLSYIGITDLSAKKRVFTLSSKCKFYKGGGGSPSRLNDLRVKKISKAKAKKLFEKYNGNDVIIRVKNRKVVEIIFASLCYV